MIHVIKSIILNWQEFFSFKNFVKCSHRNMVKPPKVETHYEANKQERECPPLGAQLEDYDLSLSLEYDKTIIEYYSTSGLDYEPWSENFNMHFGYYRLGVNPFKRENLLEEMNKQVIELLELSESNGKISQLIDLGCGVGATARYCAKALPNTRVTGATIVKWQINKAEALTDYQLIDTKVTFKQIDYRALPFENEVYDGAYAVESSCYDHGLDKKQFLKEAYRVLKPGARLVISDGFRLRKQGSSLFEACYKKVCEGWSLETFAELGSFVEAMQQCGFEDIKINDISYRIAPSVAYVPWVSIKYFFNSVIWRKGEKKFKKLHLIAPVFGLVVGLHRKDFAYFHISARKPD